MTKEEIQKLGVPDDLAGESMFTDVPDVAGVFKIARDLRGKLGNAVRIPGPQAPAADLEEFEKTLTERVPGLVRLPQEEPKVLETLRARGYLPKAEADYSFDGVQVPEGVQLSDEVQAALRKEAVELGLTKGAFKARAQRVANDLAAVARAPAERKATLKSKLGAAYDERLAMARKVAEQTGAPQRVRDGLASGDIDEETVNQYAVTLSKMLGEARPVAGDQGGRGGGPQAMTPLEAEQRIEEIYRNPVLANRASNAQLYDQLVKELARLEAMAHPDLARQAAREMEA